MKRKHKQYSRPKRPFDKTRIDQEAKIKEDFGLKNKKEIWRAEARIGSIREKAKKLIGAEESKQQALFEKLNKQGLKVNSIADILGLEKEDYLNRRLQTIVVKKGLASTQKAARQLVTHKKVLVNGRAIDSPSYIVPISLEEKISLKPAKKKAAVKKEAPKEEAPVEKKEEPKKTPEEVPAEESAPKEVLSEESKK